MKAAWSFLLYELRRHVPQAVGGWLLLLVLPIIHRLSMGSWRYWSSEWTEPMATIAAYIIAPVVAFYLASSGWAVERSRGFLRWIYARPLPATRIFLIRLLAVFAVTAVWTEGALLINGVSASGLLAWMSLHPAVAVGAWLVGVGLGVGGGCLASILFQGRDAIILSTIVGALILLVLVPWVTLEIAPTTAALLAGGRSHLISSALVYGGLLTLALLAGAWYAMKRTPADQLRRLRAALATGPISIVAGVALWVMILQPLAVSPQTSGVRWLGEGVTLRFAGAPGLEPWIQHPVLADENGDERPFRRAFAMPGLVLAHSGRGRAVVREVGSYLWHRLADNPWLVIDRGGEMQRLELAGSGRVHPIGWSPGGTRFAWKETYWHQEELPKVSRLAVMNDELQVAWVTFETPTPEYTATWIDDDRLLVVRAMFSSRAGWWMIVKADGAIELGPETLPQGDALYSPALAYPLEYYLRLDDPNLPTISPAPLARRDSEPVLYSSNCDDEVSQIVTLDTRTGELRPLPETRRATPMACRPLPGGFVRAGLVSLGPLADGGLVWAEPVSASETRIVRMHAAASEPRQVCTFRGDDADVGGYRGTTGSWAFWSDFLERRLFACQVETGEVRSLALRDHGGARAVDIVDGGVLTASGIIELN